MHPIICTLGPFSIFSYGLMLVIAFFVSSSLAVQEAKRQKIDPGIVSNLLYIVFISGIIGARVFYVLENLRYYFAHSLEIILLQMGGLSWFGGLILGTAAGIIYLRKKKPGLIKIIDLIIPYVALGQSIGRIGCLLNGCCYGMVSRFGIYFEVHEARLIPTQIYSSLALLAIFIILRFLQDRSYCKGELFLIYLFLYSIKRFFIEFWRADNAIVFLNLTFFQIISIALFFFVVIFLIKNRLARKLPRQ